MEKTVEILDMLAKMSGEQRKQSEQIKNLSDKINDFQLPQLQKKVDKIDNALFGVQDYGGLSKQITVLETNLKNAEKRIDTEVKTRDQKIEKLQKEHDTELKDLKTELETKVEKVKTDSDAEIKKLTAFQNKALGIAAGVNAIILIVSFLFNIYKEMPKQEPTYEKPKLENRTEKNQGASTFRQKSFWQDYHREKTAIEAENSETWCF